MQAYAHQNLSNGIAGKRQISVCWNMAQTFFRKKRKKPFEYMTPETFQYISFKKNAVEVLLGSTVNVITSDGDKKLDAAEIEIVSDLMAAAGLRVLGIAMRKWETLPADMSIDNMGRPPHGAFCSPRRPISAPPKHPRCGIFNDDRNCPDS